MLVNISTNADVSRLVSVNETVREKRNIHLISKNLDSSRKLYIFLQ